MFEEIYIPAKSGEGFKVKRGQSFRVIDVEGEQVADLVAVNANNTKEILDPGATMDTIKSKDLKVNDMVYSNLYQPMLTILDDKVGKHGLLLSACRIEMYKLLYGKSTHANCYENLSRVLAKFNIEPMVLHRPFNIFMNTVVGSNGEVSVERPVSKAGDYIELRAEMDLYVAISACPTEESPCNGYNPTSIKVEFH